MASVSRVGSRVWLKDAQACNLAHGRAELIQALVGRARALNELVDGQPAVSGEASCLPPNPQGLVGIDHSGPPWGSVWRQPVAWLGGRGTDATDWQGPDDTTPIVHVSSRAPAALKWNIWLRPHEVLPQGYIAPYGLLQMRLRARVRSATATLTVKGKVDDGPLTTLSSSLALTTTMTNMTPATSLAFPGGGGRFYLVHLEFSTSAGTAEVECLSLNVSAKRDAG